LFHCYSTGKYQIMSMWGHNQTTKGNKSRKTTPCRLNWCINTCQTQLNLNDANQVEYATRIAITKSWTKHILCENSEVCRMIHQRRTWCHKIR
jgi:hypothetical protein